MLNSNETVLSPAADETILCFSCGSRVLQKKRRTICPFCGNFFSCDTAQNIRSSSVSYSVSDGKPKSGPASWLFRMNGGKAKSTKMLSNQTDSSLPVMKVPSMVNVSSKRNSLDIAYEISSENFEQLVRERSAAENWQGLTGLLGDVLASSRLMIGYFRKKGTTYELNHRLLDMMHESLHSMPDSYQDIIRNAVEKCLKSFDGSKFSPETYCVLIAISTNPLLGKQEYLRTFVAVLSTILHSQTKTDQAGISNVIVRLPILKFREIIQRIQGLLTYCLLSENGGAYMKGKYVGKWKETAVKSIEFMYRQNLYRVSQKQLDFKEFYNCLLDNEELDDDFDRWKKFKNLSFSYCSHPCVLSIHAKKQIIQTESHKQMSNMAKQTLLTTVKQHQVPEFDMLFLNLSIRRKHLVADSVNEIIAKQNELKKKLKVTFVGEPGLDMGGLTKEWFLLLLRQILYSQASVFYYDKKTRINWFRNMSTKTDYKEFYLTGVLMGLAVYNSINLDVRFPLVCYKKLLSVPIKKKLKETLGVCPVSLEDLKTVYPDLAKGLEELLECDGDVENDICATYDISYEDISGNVKNHSLKPNGSTIRVTKENRKEYVSLYCNFLLNISIYEEFRAFYLGFHSVCDSEAFKLLRPEEVDSLVCGNPVIDLAELKTTTSYDGYKPIDTTILLFWEVLLEFSENLQKLFLHFTTGSDRVPIGGIKELNFKISKANNTKMLPMAYTCFNQLLLPPYEEKNKLKLKLLISMENSEGFGLK